MVLEQQRQTTHQAGNLWPGNNLRLASPTYHCHTFHMTLAENKHRLVSGISIPEQSKDFTSEADR